MNKKFGVLLVVGLLMFMLVGTLVINFVSGDGFKDATPNANAEKTGISAIINSLFDKWEEGEGIGESTAKYLFLILLGVFIYSLLSSSEFPENAIFRIILSFIVAFLATWYITPGEVYGILTAYTGLGLVLSIFLPVAIIIFATMIIAKKANPIGIFFAKFLWGAYGIWLIVKGGLVFIMRFGIKNPSLVTFKEVTTMVNNNPVIHLEMLKNAAVPAEWVKVIVNGFSNEILREALKTDTVVGLMLLFGGLILFYIGVIKSKWVQEWTKKVERETVITNFKDEMKKARAFMSEAASVVEDTGKGKET